MRISILIFMIITSCQVKAQKSNSFTVELKSKTNYPGEEWRLDQMDTVYLLSKENKSLKVFTNIAKQDSSFKLIGVPVGKYNLKFVAKNVVVEMLPIVVCSKCDNQYEFNYQTQEFAKMLHITNNELMISVITANYYENGMNALSADFQKRLSKKDLNLLQSLPAFKVDLYLTKEKQLSDIVVTPEHLSKEIKDMISTALTGMSGWIPALSMREFIDFDYSFDKYQLLNITPVSSLITQAMNEARNEEIALGFYNEIIELKNKFEIINAAEEAPMGLYRPSKAKVIKVKLKSKEMFSNVSIDLYLTHVENTIYTRDSILVKGPDMVTTVQNIPFIERYLKGDKSRRLIINFADNGSINKEVSSLFNTDPEKWKSNDKRIADFKRDDSLGIKYDYSPAAIKLTTSIDCGCNFRINNDFLEQGICFEINDINRHEWSRWILLPDSTLILWHIRGKGFLNYTKQDLGTNSALMDTDVCRKFSMEGKLL